MGQAQRWKVLSARIEGFVDGVSIWSNFDSAMTNGSQGKQLYAIAQSIFQAIEAEGSEKNASIPPNIFESEITKRLRKLLTPPVESVSSAVQGFVGEAAILLKSFVTEANYFFADNDAVLRTLSERAFLHLNWTIVADRQSQATWQAAFDEGEVASEKLGAAHLLWHGIYPFKVINRVATDLILEEPINSDQV